MYHPDSTAAITGTTDRWDSIAAAWTAPESRYGDAPTPPPADGPTAEDRRDWAAMTAAEPTAAEPTAAELFWEEDFERRCEEYESWSDSLAARYEEQELAEFGMRAGYDD